MSIEASYAGVEHDRTWRALVCPRDYANPTPKARYHLAVIGAGPAGLVTAIAAAGLGARVALIEKTAMGGDCLNVGCVPSKALLEYSATYRGKDHFDDAFAWLRATRAKIAEHDSIARYTAAGVDVFLGEARFIDGHTIDVGGLRLRARRSVIATGAHAALPPIPGLAECRPLTNETVFELRAQPERLAILGAGPIGCEMAQVFARLDTHVDLIERADRILPTELPEASRAVADALARDGVSIHVGVSVSRIERSGTRVRVATSDGEILAQEILVAAGRKPNSDHLNLLTVGVETDEAGLITVDKRLRTTNPRIYAAGDVCSRAQFTHNADAHARIVVQNALFLPTKTTRRLTIPHCTYTDPEVAQVGALPTELERDGVPYDTYRIAFSELDRGKAQADDQGFASILTEKGNGRILGATIVGHDAGEQIAPICIAISNDLGLGSFASSVLPYPTRAEFLRRLADTINRKRLTPTVERIMRLWFQVLR
jgi:pyruvate/2-oxoglutarate dehydrogenase complex dihydrolipoamide dehydrogenase (E3) component